MKEDVILRKIGENCKKRRLALHLTQVQVAERAGITSTHYARIEGGKTTPSILTILAVIKALKSTSSDILPL